jgi:hypothetical protein
VTWLLMGSIPGVLLSSGLTLRLPDRLLRVSLSIVLVASGVRLLELPHANVSALAVLALGALGVAAMGLLRVSPAPIAVRVDRT